MVQLASACVAASLFGSSTGIFNNSMVGYTKKMKNNAIVGAVSTSPCYFISESTENRGGASPAHLQDRRHDCVLQQQDSDPDSLELWRRVMQRQAPVFSCWIALTKFPDFPDCAGVPGQRRTKQNPRWELIQWPLAGKTQEESSKGLEAGARENLRAPPARPRRCSRTRRQQGPSEVRSAVKAEQLNQNNDPEGREVVQACNSRLITGDCSRQSTTSHWCMESEMTDLRLLTSFSCETRHSGFLQDLINTSSTRATCAHRPPTRANGLIRALA